MSEEQASTTFSCLFFVFIHISHVHLCILASCSSFQALYSYVPQNEDELELKEGDLVSVMEKCDDGWFVGMCRGPHGRFHGGAVTLAVSH